MLVRNMNETEIFQELLKDMPNVIQESDRHDKKFRRMVLKSILFPVRPKAIRYTSPRKNKWLIQLEARSKKEIGENSRIHSICYVDVIGRGYYAYMITSTNERWHMTVYPPHFFSRYAQRCNIDLYGVDLIEHFFKDNYNYAFSEKKELVSENQYIHYIYGATSQGVAMGVLTIEGNVLFRTFITYEMSKGEQIDEFAKSQQIRAEIHEKEKL